MGYYKKEVICSNGFKVVTKCQMPSYGKGGKRAPRSQPTPEAKRQYNLRKAAEKLYLLLLCNFFPGDYNLAFTYPAGQVMTETAANDIFREFVRLYRAYCKQSGYECDYVYNTEVSPRGHVHHHAILHNRRDLETIEELWKKAGGGAVQYRGGSKLRSNYDWYGLAMYYIDRTKGGKLPDTHVQGKRRYNCSHGLRRPVVRIEWVDADRWYKPRSTTDYELLPETVYSGRHELSGASFIKYTMMRRQR